MFGIIKHIKTFSWSNIVLITLGVFKFAEFLYDKITTWREERRQTQKRIFDQAAALQAQLEEEAKQKKLDEQREVERLRATRQHLKDAEAKAAELAAQVLKETQELEKLARRRAKEQAAADKKAAEEIAAKALAQEIEREHLEQIRLKEEARKQKQAVERAESSFKLKSSAAIYKPIVEGDSGLSKLLRVTLLKPINPLKTVSLADPHKTCFDIVETHNPPIDYKSTKNFPAWCPPGSGQITKDISKKIYDAKFSLGWRKIKNSEHDIPYALGWYQQFPVIISEPKLVQGTYRVGDAIIEFNSFPIQYVEGCSLYELIPCHPRKSPNDRDLRFTRADACASVYQKIDLRWRPIRMFGTQPWGGHMVYKHIPEQITSYEEDTNFRYAPVKPKCGPIEPRPTQYMCAYYII